MPHRLEQLDGGEAGIGNGDDASMRQPERRLE
jgi:hypothetical protein